MVAIGQAIALLQHGSDLVEDKLDIGDFVA